MLAFKSTFLYKSIWRIRLTEETRRVFEVGSEQLQKHLINHARVKSGWLDIPNSAQLLIRRSADPEEALHQLYPVKGNQRIQVIASGHGPCQ